MEIADKNLLILFLLALTLYSAWRAHTELEKKVGQMDERLHEMNKQLTAVELDKERKSLSDEMRIHQLEEKITKLTDANKNNLPFRTAEEIEHAKAMWILLNDDLDLKKTIVDSLGAHLDKARENKRLVP